MKFKFFLSWFLLLFLSVSEAGVRINVERYGANGLDSENDFIAFKKAFEVASQIENSEIYIPPGTYRIQYQNLSDRLEITSSLVADEGSKILILPTLGHPHTPGIAISGDGLVIKNLSVSIDKETVYPGSTVLIRQLSGNQINIVNLNIDCDFIGAHGLELVGDISSFSMTGGSISNCQLGVFKTSKRVSIQNNITFNGVRFINILGEGLALNSPAHKLHLIGLQGEWEYKDLIVGELSGANFPLLNPGSAHSVKVTNQTELKVRYEDGEFLSGESVTNGKGATAIVKEFQKSKIQNVVVRKCIFINYQVDLFDKKNKRFAIDLAHVKNAVLTENFVKGEFNEAYHVEDGSENIKIKGGDVELSRINSRGIRIFSPSRNITIEGVKLGKFPFQIDTSIGIDLSSKPVKQHSNIVVNNVIITGFQRGLYIDRKVKNLKLNDVLIDKCSIGIQLNMPLVAEFDNTKISNCDIKYKTKKDGKSYEFDDYSSVKSGSK